MRNFRHEAQTILAARRGTDTDTPMPMPMPMPGGATMLVSRAGDGQRSDGGPALAALACAWEEQVRPWVYGICVTWI